MSALDYLTSPTGPISSTKMLCELHLDRNLRNTFLYQPYLWQKHNCGHRKGMKKLENRKASNLLSTTNTGFRFDEMINNPTDWPIIIVFLCWRHLYTSERNLAVCLSQYCERNISRTLSRTGISSNLAELSTRFVKVQRSKSMWTHGANKQNKAKKNSESVQRWARRSHITIDAFPWNLLYMGW